MTPAEFRKLTFWVDYDRPKLPQLTDVQRIEYFRRRANMVVLRPLRYLLRGIRPTSARTSTVLCFGTSACCAIEAFGRFRFGLVRSGQGRRAFESFVREFMSRNFMRRLHNKTYCDLLHEHFRNGLAHGLAIKWGGFEGSRSYLRSRNSAGVSHLLIDPQRLHDDLERAVERFVEALKSAPDRAARRQLFNRAFEALWVKGQ